MSYVVLARKWRPMSFRDLIGQEHVSRTLANAIARGRVAHAFLFTGVRGVGKTTSARILAKALNCLDPQQSAEGGVEPCLACAACREIAEGIDVDVREIDGASYTGVDEIRKLQESLPYRPVRDRYKIFIVDEVHMLSQNAWNALLKTLEEPPPHVKFILATTEVHKVPVTILSRVQRFDFKMIPSRLIAERIRYVLREESIEADDRAVALVAREAAGSMRDALSLLDQVIAFSPKQLIGDEVSRVLGVAGYLALSEIGEAVLRGDAGKALHGVASLADQSCDLSVTTRELMGFFRDLVVAKLCKEPDALLDLADDERARVKALAAAFGENELVRVQRGFATSYDDISRSPEPRAALEMLLARLALRPELFPLDELLGRLADLEARLAGGKPPPGGSGRASPGGGGPRPAGPRSVASAAPLGPATAPPGPPAAPPGPAASRPEPAPSAPRAQPVPGPAASPAQPAPRPPAPAPDPLAAPRPEPVPPPPQARAATPAEAPAPPEARAAAAPASARGGEARPRAATQEAPERAFEEPPSSSSVDAPPTSNGAASPGVPPTPARRARAADPSARPPTDAGPPSTSPRPVTLSPDTARPARSDAGDTALTGAASEAILADWRRVLDVLGQSRPDLVAILKHTAPLALDAEALTLGYEAGNVLEVPMRAPDCLAALREAAIASLGSDRKIVFQPVTTRLATLAESDRAERERNKRAAVDRAEKHPSVRDAVEILGARVKRIEIGDNQ
jgi:DNA polymerase-3 subunit gamma/tau